MTAQLGWLDTNIFLHSLYPRDVPYARCQAILLALDEGRAEGWVDVAMVHELTYRLLGLRLFPDRLGVFSYLEEILASDSINADDKPALLTALYYWATTEVGFVDAWLTSRAERRELPICSANARHFPVHIDNSFITGDV